MNHLYQRYAPMLVRKAERMLRHREDAVDLVHTLFVDLLAQGGAVPDLPYLYRAVTNRCLNVLRDSRNRQRLLATTPWPEHTLSEEARMLTMETLLTLVKRLDARQAEVLAYYFLDDMTQDEIAEVTGISRRTIVTDLQSIRELAQKEALS